MPAPVPVVNNATFDYHYTRMPIDRIITGLCSVIVKHDTEDPDNDDAVEEYYTNWGNTGIAVTGTADDSSGNTIVTTTSSHGYSNGTVVYISGTANYNGAWAISSASGSIFTIQTPYDGSQSGTVYTADSGKPPIGAQFSAPFDGNRTVDPGRTGYGLRLGDHDVFLFSVTASVHLGTQVQTGAHSAPDLTGYADTTGTWYESVGHPKCQGFVRSTLLSRHNNAYGMAAHFYKHGVDIIAQSAHTLTSPSGIHGHSAANGLSDMIHNGIYSDENDNFEVDLSTQTNNNYFTPVHDILFEAQHVFSVTTNAWEGNGGTPYGDAPYNLYKVVDHPIDYYNLAMKIKLYSFDEDGDRNLTENAGTDTTGGTQTTHFRNRTNVFWQPFGETAELKFNKTPFTS